MREVPSNDNQVIVAVDLMNLENDINRFLIEDKAGDMAARRKLALEMRMVANDMENVS